MHGSYRESLTLEGTDLPADLGHAPADLVVLSLSDSDLNAFSEAWDGAAAQGSVPTIRMVNLAELAHPLSVDLYIDKTLQHARGVLVRLIGGVPYWEYGLRQLHAVARQRGIALVVVPADGRKDERLEALATVTAEALERIDRACQAGGTTTRVALAELARAAGLEPGALDLQAPSPDAVAPPDFGTWSPRTGIQPHPEPSSVRGCVPLVFYRSFLVADDLGPITALFDELERRGHRPLGLFVPSLKMPAAAEWLRSLLPQLRPVAIVNATSFSGKGPDGQSPLESVCAPVFQVALSTSPEYAWNDSLRGLSPADLAMHVVLPEVDGRVFAGVVSFKERGEEDVRTQFARTVHRSKADRVEAAIDRVEGWVRLGATARSDRRIAIVLSTYPNREWDTAHAVGLDAYASAQAILEDLGEAGYDVGARPDDLARALEGECGRLSSDEYRRLLGELPAELHAELQETWGSPEDDPSYLDGAFRFRGARSGRTLLMLQPERGHAEQREESYHDLVQPPRHGYVAMYLWLRKIEQLHAMVHVGAHGTVEWLPGKSVALSSRCWPAALVGGLPVAYPFVVNDPGEAAQAKRRIGAITLGHVPPPLGGDGVPERLRNLEALLDEFSNADGLHPERRIRLRDDVVLEAEALGLGKALGFEDNDTTAAALNRIDRFVCDVKDGLFAEGLHVYGRSHDGADRRFREAAEGERKGLLDALDGRFVHGGPAGSPYRGRMDVLPTGRNLYATDPRSVPTPTAFARGVEIADEFLRQHLQDEGDWPRTVILDLWGSATMRTAGEEFGMALWLVGARPRWDASSRRFRDLEVVPLSELGRPRIDVTLRMSGLFRDVFPELGNHFDRLVGELATLDEGEDDNPFRSQAGPRVYGPAPGTYGVRLPTEAKGDLEETRRDAAEAWLAASCWSYQGGVVAHDPEGIRARVTEAAAYAHVQDLPESDLLFASDYAAHEAGLVAAKQQLTDATIAAYHVDTTHPERSRARSLDVELARVVYVRATNPAWLASMRRHGYRGAAEIAATVEHLGTFAELTDDVASELIDAVYDATLGDEDMRDFLAERNPAALDAMRNRFTRLAALGQWSSLSNAAHADLDWAES
ncbi:MAG: cobaltochelatase subunit CobN [Myxococcota bacterium]